MLNNSLEHAGDWLSSSDGTRGLGEVYKGGTGSLTARLVSLRGVVVGGLAGHRTFHPVPLVTVCPEPSLSGRVFLPLLLRAGGVA